MPEQGGRTNEGLPFGSWSFQCLSKLLCTTCTRSNGGSSHTSSNCKGCLGTDRQVSAQPHIRPARSAAWVQHHNAL